MAPPIPSEFLDLMAARFRLLGELTRLVILRALMDGEKSVSRLVRETGRSQANISKHLKRMTEARLLGRRKDGLKVFYRIIDPLVERLCRACCEALQEEFQRQRPRRS